MITPDNIAVHEMIGLRIEVVDSPNVQIIGLNGTVVDETKSTFVISTKHGYKKIAKPNTKLKFYLDEQEITLSGSLLEKRSHDRLEIKI